MNLLGQESKCQTLWREHGLNHGFYLKGTISSKKETLNILNNPYEHKDGELHGKFTH